MKTALSLPSTTLIVRRIAVILLVVAAICPPAGTQQRDIQDPKAGMPYSPTGRPRLTAEWEPAIGVLIGWPLALPYKLVIQLARDSKIHVLVKDRPAMQDAIKAFTRWGIMPTQVHFIIVPQGPDYTWTRDWGPHGIFTHLGEYRLGDADYRLSTPLSGLDCQDSLRYLFADEATTIKLMQAEDAAPREIAAGLGLATVRLPFTLTGGNVLADGQRTLLSTCILGNENRYKGVSDSAFAYQIKQLLGVERHHQLSNFEDLGIQHIDCLMKLLDEERLLVARPPADHPYASQYEGIVTHELSHLRNAYGRPYQILRIDTDTYEEDKLAAYTNSLILNRHVYVPLFGIRQDSIALAQWAAAMPGYSIHGFTYELSREPDVHPEVTRLYTSIGWDAGDALHCRTRAVWDPEMIYISVDRIPEEMRRQKTYTVQAIIKDYGPGDALTATLLWRLSGDATWQRIPMNAGDYPDQFTAAIPGQMAGVEVQYVVEASAGQKTESMPRSAPAGYYWFVIR